MSFWNRERWLTEGGKGNGSTPVLPWREDCVEAAGYRLSVDKEYFVNEDGSSSVVKLDHEDTFVVNLGQFAFIMSEFQNRQSDLFQLEHLYKIQQRLFKLNHF